MNIAGAKKDTGAEFLKKNQQTNSIKNHSNGGEATLWFIDRNWCCRQCCIAVSTALSAVLAFAPDGKGIMLPGNKHLILSSMRGLLLMLTGAFLLAFVITNIHGPSRITEGGILGLSLLLKNTFALPQSLSSPILDVLCYAFAFSLMGKKFLGRSLIATSSYAVFLKIFEKTGPLVPSLYEYPLLAALIAGLLVGIACSLMMMQGAAAGGDDALAMGISRLSGLSLAKVFLLSDAVILSLSLSYLPFDRLVWSFLTTLVSSFVIGQFEIHSPVMRQTGEPPKRKAVTRLRV